MAKKEHDSNYENWLKQTDKTDSKENREWYRCPDEKKSDYIKNHSDWWKKF